MSSMWDELLDDDTRVNAFCKSGDWAAGGTGGERSQEIVREANEHMERLGHHVVVEVDALLGEEDEDGACRG
jgi:hypothetical protein